MIAVSHVQHDPPIWSCEGCKALLGDALAVYAGNSIRHWCHDCADKLIWGLQHPRPQSKSGFMPITKAMTTA